MAIPMAVGDRPFWHRLSADGWGRLGGGLLAAILGHDPALRPSSAHEVVAPTEYPAFIALFARYHQAVIDYLYGMTRDRELATNLAQDTFVRAFVAAPDLAGIAQPRAWLYRIATHLALNANRRWRPFDWLPLSRVEPGGGEGGPDALTKLVRSSQDQGDLAADAAGCDAVWTVLAALPPRWRAVLLLQTTAGLEVREIAALLQQSEANVRKILFRAKERFRALNRQLGENGAER
jgi:RNA polymerase sigma-70 factor (ECF subfamily)